MRATMPAMRAVTALLAIAFALLACGKGDDGGATSGPSQILAGGSGGAASGGKAGAAAGGKAGAAAGGKAGAGTAGFPGTTGGTSSAGTSGGKGCAPSCAGKQCGEADGCGAKCTACPSTSQICDAATWTCKGGACTPSCTGKSCGDADGCNGVCTACPTDQSCNAATKTCGSTCTPSCAGKGCGDGDGCSGTCATCPTAGDVCDVPTKTCKKPCAPACGGKACGDADGCGGVCTACPMAGQGCDTTAKACVACSLSCANGSCTFSYDAAPPGSPVCRCDPGYYRHFGSCQPVAGSPCEGFSCAGGTCAVDNVLNAPSCACDGDFIAYGSACIPWSHVRCKAADGKLVDKGSIRCSADDTAFEVCRDANGDGNVEWAPSGSPACAKGSTCSACISEPCDNGDGMGGTLKCPSGTVCMGLVHMTPVYQCVTACDCSNCGTCDPGQFTGYQRSCGSNVDDFSNPTKVCASPCPQANQGCLPYGADSFCFGNEGCASAPPK